MHEAETVERIRQKYVALAPVMDERARRQWAASEAQSLGWGGVAVMARATGLARNTIRTGIQELEHRARHPAEAVEDRVRRPGAGRKRLQQLDPQLLEALEELVDPTTRGDPESPLRWTCKSTGKLAEELTRQGHPVTDRTVAAILKEAGYSLQGNRKTREGTQHPDRNAQFEHINNQVKAFHKKRQPVVSVDTKKKEIVGDFRNGGRDWRPKGKPEEVRVHDFPDKQLGKAIPYGVYDLASNEGWVSVGITHDTAEFAVASIHRWWLEMGGVRFPSARKLMITADGGGSNGSRNRLWKVALQSLADDIGIPIHVSHFPPGTSKWNKIEHRMFCFITSNWRGRPLISHQAIVELIGNTTTKSGLVVRAALDNSQYNTKIKISDEEFSKVKLKRYSFHGDWNYVIRPHTN